MKKIFFWIAVILLSLILLTVLFLHTPFIKSKILNYIKQELAQSYNISLSAESLDYNLFKLRVSLKNFSMKSLENPSQPPFFRADLAVVQLTPALILGKKIDFAAIYLEKPVIDIHVYPDKSLNIPAQLFKKSAEPAKPLNLRRIMVKNGSLSFQDPARNIQANLQGFYLEGAIPEKGKQELILQLPNPNSGSIIFKDHRVQLDQAQFTVLLDDKDAAISLKGNYLPVNEPFTLTGKLHWQQNRVVVPEFSFSFSDGQISGQGDYFIDPTAAKSAVSPNRITLNWENLNLQAPLLTKFFAHPVHSYTNGSLDLAFRELSLKSIHANLAATFQPLKTPPLQPGFIPITGTVSLQLAEGKLMIPNFNLFAQGNIVQGKLIITNNNFQGELNGVLYNKPLISGHLLLSGQFNPDLDNPTAAARLESNGLRIDNIIDILPQGNVKYENGNLIITDMIIQAKDIPSARVIASGLIPIKMSASSSNLLDITVKGQDIPVDRLLSIINKNYAAQGTLTLEARILPQHYQANVQINSLQIARGLTPEIKWLNIGNLSGQLELLENRLNYQIQAPDLFMEIAGNGRITPPYPLEGQFTVSISDLEKLTSQLNLTFLENISGHIDGQVNFQLDLASGLKNANADIIVNKLSLHSQGQDLENLEPIHVSLSPAGITVHKMELQGLGSQISGSGFLPGGAFEKAPPGPPQNVSLGLTFLAQIDPALLNLFIPSLQFNGQINLRANVSGSLTRPLLTTELTIDKFTFEKLPTQSITTATSTDKGFRGLVTGYIRTSGNVRNLDEFSAEAQFPVLELHLPGITILRSPEPVTLRLEKGRLQVQQMSFVDESAFSTFTIDGTLNVADLTGPQPLDFTVNGRLDARLAGLFLEDFYFDGQNDLSLQIKGNLQKPGITGSLDMHNFELNVPGEKIFINRVNGKILFQDNRITVGPLSGKLNDGSLDVEGEIITGAGGFQEMNINVTTARNHFEFPKGLFSEASAKLNFSFIDQEYLLSGTVEIDEGIYKEPFNILNKIFNYLGSSRIQEISQQGTFSERLNLDIEVHTISPIYVDTNFSRSEITTDLSIGGTLARPNLSGRVMMKEGGEIYLGKNRFVVESGIINFVNPYRIDPEFNIRARSKVNNYDILLSITGTLSTLAVNVNSTPPLPQPGIIGLLIGNGGTGTGENATFLDFVGSRALGYLSSAIFGSVEKLFQGTLGIETFRLDGSLIASKDNPGARLTVGHHLTPNLELILSQSLTKAQNRTWILDYKPLPNFSIEARKQDKENYTASLLGEIYFGYRGETAETIEPGKRTAKPLKISDVQIQGNTVLPLSLIYKNLKLRKGKKFNFFKYRDDLERLRKLYRENQFLRADIDNEHIEQDNQVIIRYTIEAGPRVYLDFYGTNLPPFLKKMINSWYREQFGLQSTRYVEQEIYLQLYKKGYYQAQVRTGDPIEGDNFIRFPFYIETGIKYNKAHFLFTGNNQVSDKSLNRFLKNAKLRTLTFHDPKQVVEELTNYYQEKGFLEVKIRLLENSYIPRSQKAEVEFLIIEGPRARIGQITFTGNRVLSDSELLKAIKLKKNHIFSPVKLDDAGYEIANAYAKKGFNNVQLTNTRQYVSKIGVMNLEFQVEENQRGIIREITITGNSLTKPQTIRRELTFKEGDILDFNEINKSRMKLYELEIFEWIDIETQPLDEELPGNEKPFRIVINLREMRPYRVKGGLQWDMDKKLGGIFEFSTPNIAGKAHYLGTSIILDQKENGFKAYYRLPYLFKQKIGTEFFVFAGKKKEPSFTISRKGFTVQQQLKYWRRLLVSLSYTFERDHIVKPAILSIPALMSAPGPALDTRFNLGYLTAALTYDRRNNIIDPTRGFFLSGSWLYVQKFLGAQVNFYRFYIEGQLYLPVTRFLVIASSLKAGSGRGLGKEFLPGERFFAGGGNTLRGFKESMVGPLDANGNPLGGEALFLFNEELRIRLNKMFILVLFADLGNVYAAAKEFNIFNVRKSIGFGLRVYVGPLLLRGDIGFILNRRPGEPTSAIILSIGQTF